MLKSKNIFFAALFFTSLLSGCAVKQAPMVMETDSAVPGTKVARNGQELALTGTGIMVGQKLPETGLVDAATMKPVDLSSCQGQVLLLSIVPSIDTKVCEAQTHYLGEQGDKLPAEIKRITVSRDTPFAQTRFAKEAKLDDVQYLSDYKEGEFGRSIGLLMDGPRLLARSIIIVDKQGIVQYIQVVPEITHLPDMEEAFARAIALNNL
ncbi:peroxiredoxin [Desulforhopalus sp. IMCC35007]|uniref:thiol peroxidase n=1 Tax=Desulforhopalus sp. IMCC35007 TaxID=2569543 RepID=UPI0010AED222|nr:peroxiredoxin [Desulforhopalus sp. IMCC35007]TKB11081.1 peroxiredoxin [Desulforhopalus sp. IMCC35007]